MNIQKIGFDLDRDKLLGVMKVTKLGTNSICSSHHFAHAYLTVHMEERRKEP